MNDTVVILDLRKLEESTIVEGMATKTRLIGSTEAAEILGYSRATVNRWAAEGKLVPVLKGDGTTGPRFFKRTDVERMRDEQRRNNAA